MGFPFKYREVMAMRNTALLIVVLVVLSSAPCATAQDGLDPVVDDVVRMLDEKVGEDLISGWLDRSGERPSKIGPDELIALSRAGASQNLIDKLVDLVQTVEPAQDVSKVAEAAPVLVVAARPPVQDSLQPGSPLPVEFTINYDPEMVEYQTTPWDLFVYLDGRPVGSVDGWSSHTSTHKASLSFRIDVPRGRHVIRVFQEQHTIRSRRSGTWNHAARVYDRPIVLDLDREGAWKVEITVREKGSFFGRGAAPLEYAIFLDGKVVESAPSVDAGWPDLCEEVLTAFPGEKGGSKTARKALKGCLYWGSLWEGQEGLPDRETVRDRLQEVEFRPGPGIR